MPGAARLEGKVALVTGGGSGIGRAVCQALSAHGARIAVLDRDLAAAEATARTLGTAAQAIAVDVADETDVESATARAADSFGRIDIGVNAAGVGASAPMIDTTLEQWRKVLDVCLTGVFLCARAQARQMIRQGAAGVLIQIASTNARQPGEGLSAYCAAKAGVEMFTRVTALELARYGIRVNGVGPGLTETPMVARFLSDPEAREAFVSNIPLGRPASPEVIAAAVAFLASDEAAYVTGQTLYVDGGALMQRYPSLSARKPRSAAVPPSRDSAR